MPLRVMHTGMMSCSGMLPGSPKHVNLHVRYYKYMPAIQPFRLLFSTHHQTSLS